MPVLDLGLQPMCDDLVAIGEARQTVTYPTRIAICPACLTAHQTFNISKETLFPKNYHYRPRFTQDVLQGMKQLTFECIERFGPLTGKLVCDVGCSDASLLNYFRGAGAKTCGIEPTNAALEAADAGHSIINDFFSPASARRLVSTLGRPDIVTFTNVFAHIENLGEAIAALKILIKAETIVVIENHYLGTVLDTNQFDTFYHEHPRTYSLRSFQVISRDLGGEIISVVFPKRYGGNIRVYIGGFNHSKVGGKHAGPIIAPIDETRFPKGLARVQQFVDAWKARTRKELAELAASGMEICGKSFPGRAAILVNLLDLDVDQHPVVYEKPGSLKIGHYVPGTRIPIVSDDRWIAGDDVPEALIVWGWHIASEIAIYLRERGYQGRIFTPLPRLTEI